jgi:hypothetical protein
MISFLKIIFTSLLGIHSSFLHIFYFSNISNMWTVKLPILKFRGGRRGPSPSNFKKISVKFAEFINPDWNRAKEALDYEDQAAPHAGQ